MCDGEAKAWIVREERQGGGRSTVSKDPREDRGDRQRLTLSSANRPRQADRLREYFDVQLRFAAAVADRSDLALGEACARYTNFHRRFGLGRIDGRPTSAHWHRYARCVEELGDHESRVRWTQEHFIASPPETPRPGGLRAGCFGCELRADGAARIHFENLDAADGVGPLSTSKRVRRFQELVDLFTRIHRDWPEVTYVVGGSWLYHLVAYRRLFPPAYLRSIAPPTRTPRFDGTSSWGQFLDHRGEVHIDRVAAFRGRLEGLDLDSLRSSFPLPVLAACSPIEAFFEFYAIGSRQPSGWCPESEIRGTHDS